MTKKMHYEDKQMANKTWFDWHLFWSEQVQGRNVRLQTTRLDTNVSKIPPTWKRNVAFPICSQYLQSFPGNSGRARLNLKTHDFEANSTTHKHSWLPSWCEKNEKFSKWGAQ